VFEPFFTTKPRGQGTGQGLAIAHAAIVERHHGTLDFDSVPGQGALFHISLPLAASRGAAA
jgi:signal transduction histidine kinase